MWGHGPTTKRYIFKINVAPFLLCSFRNVGRVCHSIITRTPPLLSNHESNSYPHEFSSVQHIRTDAHTHARDGCERCRGYNDDGLRTVTRS